jgi:hypothetical protein
MSIPGEIWLSRAGRHSSFILLQLISARVSVQTAEQVANPVPQCRNFIIRSTSAEGHWWLRFTHQV